jgi:hypothetical protein
MQLLLAAALAFSASAQAQEAAKFDHDHALWTEVLAAHVEGDRFDYRALAKDRSKLDAYVAQLETVDAETLAGWNENQRHAFWINAYNAYTIQLVAAKYPLKSIKDIGGVLSSVWDRHFIPLNALHPKGKDKRLSLNDIEHKILRPRFKDARVHAAVNCASQGCPPLRAEAFTAKGLDEQLDSQVRSWLADEKRNKFDRAKRTLQLSKIFDWWKDDFVRDEKSVRAYVAKYAPADVAAWLGEAENVTIRHLNYSWKLNDVARKD